MRIGMMADVYKPHISGVTNYIALNKKYLEKLGHEVYVFTFGDEDYPNDEPNIIRSPGLPLLDTGYYLSLRYSQHAQALLHTMDVVHVHHPFISGSLALRYCRPRRIPIVFTNHTRYDLYAQAYVPILGDFIGETAMATYLPLFCRYCDLVIAPSPGIRQVLQNFGVDTPIEVIPNGVDIKPFRQITPSSLRQSFGFSADDVILIYVGRLGPEKNLSFLLRSFAGAALAFDHLHLMLVGDGPEADNLKDRVQYMQLETRVHFTGMVPYEQLPGYLTLADAFVTASVTEVHPLSVIEAMAAGLPVLGIRSPGVGDIVEDGVTGYLADQEDLAAFTAKMVRLVTDPVKRREMGQKAYQEAEKYAIENTTQLMIERYQQVIQKTRVSSNGFGERLKRYFQKWRV